MIPSTGYLASVGGYCGGSLVGSTCTTNAIVADYSVIASFTAGANSTTTLISSLNPSNFGQTVTLTATVCCGSGKPVASVEFRDGDNVIPDCASVAFSGSVGQCVYSRLPAGTRAQSSRNMQATQRTV